MSDPKSTETKSVYTFAALPDSDRITVTVEIDPSIPPRFYVDRIDCKGARSREVLDLPQATLLLEMLAAEMRFAEMVKATEAKAEGYTVDASKRVAL